MTIDLISRSQRRRFCHGHSAYEVYGRFTFSKDSSILIRTTYSARVAAAYFHILAPAAYTTLLRLLQEHSPSMLWHVVR